MKTISVRTARCNAMRNFSLGVLCLAICGCSGGNSTNFPSVLTGNSTKRIVFVSNRNGGNFRLYSMNVDGSDQKPFGPAIGAPITGATPPASSPNRLPSNALPRAISPDGSKIVFNVRNNSGVGSELYVMDTSGGNLKLLSSKLTENPAWRADGKQIAFSHGSNVPPDGVSLVNVDGSDEHQIVGGRNYPDYPTFSPDSKNILLTLQGNASLSAFQLENSQLQQVVGETTAQFSNVFQPVYSPDGRFIAFGASPRSTDGNGRPANVFIMNRDGTHLVQLTNGALTYSKPVFVAGGTKIAYEGTSPFGDNSSYDVYIVNLDGSNTKRLTENSNFDALISQ